MKYFLLEEDDKVKKGDEFYDKGHWKQVKEHLLPYKILRVHNPHRRSVMNMGAIEIMDESTKIEFDVVKESTCQEMSKSVNDLLSEGFNMGQFSADRDFMYLSLWRYIK